MVRTIRTIGYFFADNIIDMETLNYLKKTVIQLVYTFKNVLAGC